MSDDSAHRIVLCMKWGTNLVQIILFQTVLKELELIWKLDLESVFF